MRKRIAPTLATVTAALAILAVTAPGVSLAARAHSLGASGFFGGPAPAEEPGEAGTLDLAGEPTAQSSGSGLAVDEVSHDVYVADTGNRRVDVFTAAGTFVAAWGWGVSTGAPELQVCTEQSHCEQGLSGSSPGEFEAPSYVAVDNDPESPSHGDVYVADTGDDVVTKFTAAGVLVSGWAHEGQLAGSPSERFNEGQAGAFIAGIAVDGSGSLWVYDIDEQLFKFDQVGTWLATCSARSGTGRGGIAVDDTCMEDCALFTHTGFGVITLLDPQCGDLGPVSSAQHLGELENEGVGVDGTDGDVYVVHEHTLVEDLPGGCVQVPSESGCFPSQMFGEGTLVEGTGLAVDSESGAVYVADAHSDTVDRFAVVVESAAAPAVGVSAHEEVLHGSVNPVGTELSSCRFEYGDGAEGEYTGSVPCEEKVETIGNGVAPVPVEVQVPGLQSGTKYHFRVRAVSAAGTVVSEPESLTTAVTAVVRKVSVSGLTGTGATLEASINPENLEAHYHFEYGPCPAGACAGAPYTVQEPAATLTAGEADVAVSQPVNGLTPGVTYHFRVVVSDTDGEPLSTPEGTFVVEPAGPECSLSRPGVDAGLADCRAYEMVTPPGKNGALINNGAFLSQPSVSADGSRVLAQSIQCFHGPSSCTAIRQTEGSTYSFERSPSGWATTPLAPPVSTGSSVLTFNADTQDVLYAAANTASGHEALWARDADGSVHEIGPVAEARGPKIGEISAAQFVATSNLSRVVTQGRELWPSLEGGTKEPEPLAYPGAKPGEPDLVAVTGPPGSTDLISACGALLGEGKNIGSAYGSLSADGQAIFFTAKACGVAVPADTVYERVVNGEEARTVRVSGPGPAAVCDSACQVAPPRDASFEGASTDGTNVFFTDTSQLTNEASEDHDTADNARTPGCAQTSPGASGCNLYEFTCPAHCKNEGEQKLIDVSAGDSSGLGPQVQGVVAIAPDGSDVFFVAHGVLTDANGSGAEPVAGLDNLYVYRAGHLVFIATLPASDAALWHKEPGIGIANVTPDGGFLVFTSHRALTGDVSRGEGPAQVYRYDTATGVLVRVSVGEDGFNDDGNKGVDDARIVSADHSFANGDGPGSASPSVSDNGEIVVFETPTGLTPGALDDQAVIGDPSVLAENVYEWEAPGAQPSADSPACGDPAGCVSLISDGKDRSEGTDQHENESAVELLGIDASGRNVFFWTAQSILPQDKDSQVDLYDARVEGGFQEAPAEEACGSLTACHGEQGPGAPVFGALGSASFIGPGNPIQPSITPPPAPKPRALSRAQQLAKALAACHKNKRQAKRVKCEKAARKLDGPVKRPTGKSKRPKDAD